MRLLQTRKPRPFNHRMIYSHNRRDELKTMGEHSRRPAHRGMSTSLTIAMVVLLLLLLWIVSH